MKRHAQALPKVVNEVLEKVPIENIDAVAVTNRPGLNGSLVMGRNYAQYLCYKYRKRKCIGFHIKRFTKCANIRTKIIDILCAFY